MRFGNVTLSLEMFGSRDKKKFFAFLIAGGMGGNIEKMWKEYKQAQKEFKKFK
jgi:hypothetical protein